MHDADLRQALHRRLARQHRDDPHGTRILDEFGICGQVRVDVAVVNGALTGYELKSARDTLKRLPRQADYYSRVLDYAHIVVADTHAAHALQMVPSWWGCTIATTDADGRVELTVRRAGRENPGIDPDALALLLWRGEALAALDDPTGDWTADTAPRPACRSPAASPRPYPSTSCAAWSITPSQSDQAGDQLRCPCDSRTPVVSRLPIRVLAYRRRSAASRRLSVLPVRSRPAAWFPYRGGRGVLRGWP